MAAPRILITDLPEQTAVTDTDLFVVQNGTTTKKMTVGRISTATATAINAHINKLTGAHAASAISAIADPVLAGSDVQGQLSSASAKFGTRVVNAGGIATLITMDLASYNALVTKDPATLYCVPGTGFYLGNTKV